VVRPATVRVELSVVAPALSAPLTVVEPVTAREVEVAPAVKILPSVDEAE